VRKYAAHGGSPLKAYVFAAITLVAKSRRRVSSTETEPSSLAPKRDLIGIISDIVLRRNPLRLIALEFGIRVTRGVDGPAARNKCVGLKR
jgi:hypothetical protein